MEEPRSPQASASPGASPDRSAGPQPSTEPEWSTRVSSDETLTASLAEPAEPAQLTLFPPEDDAPSREPRPVPESIRRLVPARDDLRPLYVTGHGLSVGKSSEVLRIKDRDGTVQDFVRVGPAVALNTAGRRGFIRAYEQRIDTLVTHPLFAYRVNYRRVLEIQARLLARVVTGELSAYAGFARVVSCRGPRPRPAASERTPARRNPVLTDPAQSALQRRRDELLPTRGPAQAAIEAGERHLAPVAHERQRGSQLDRIVAA